MDFRTIDALKQLVFASKGSPTAETAIDRLASVLDERNHDNRWQEAVAQARTNVAYRT